MKIIHNKFSCQVGQDHGTLNTMQTKHPLIVRCMFYNHIIDTSNISTIINVQR